MAKKSMKIKQARPQKYKTREYNRCIVMKNSLCKYNENVPDYFGTWKRKERKSLPPPSDKTRI